MKIFIKRIGFTLIRVHRQQVISTQTPTAELLLQNLKWPIETMFVGLRPTSQKTGQTPGLGIPVYPAASQGDGNGLSNWHKFSMVDYSQVSMPNLVTKASTFTGVIGGSATPAVPGQAVTVTPVFAQAYATVEQHIKTIDTVTVSAHGIYLYNNIPADFFNAYTAYTYGGPHITSPDDEGALMIPFNLYPGTYQPSGHVNVSRAREFYFTYTSSVVGQIVGGSPVQGEISVLASAINFLLISDGSAVNNILMRLTGNCFSSWIYKLEKINSVNKSRFNIKRYNYLVFCL